MSQDRPDRPPAARFLAVLGVKRNLVIGLVVGCVFTAAVYGFFVVVGGGSSAGILSGYYLALAFTLATTVAATVAIALTVWNAIKLSRELEDANLPEP